MTDDDKNSAAKVIPITKPKFSLNKFKSKRAAAIGGLETLQGALPHYPIAHAKDFVRLHPDQDKYWTDELCFVSVPIKGTKKDLLHLIDEDVAAEFLPSGRLQWFRFALATKPFDIFFLCHVPTRNLDENTWNISNVKACEQARHNWVQVSSRKEEGVEAYKADVARDPDAFPKPKWPTQSIEELIGATFEGRSIYDEEHPALKRLVGAKQSVT